MSGEKNARNAPRTSETFDAFSVQELPMEPSSISLLLFATIVRCLGSRRRIIKAVGAMVRLTATTNVDPAGRFSQPHVFYLRFGTFRFHQMFVPNHQMLRNSEIGTRETTRRNCNENFRFHQMLRSEPSNDAIFGNRNSDPVK